MMNVLILGGEQACGPGLPAGKGYVAQFIRRLSSTRHPVQVDFHAVTIAEAIQFLPRIDLAAYDLILLQFDLALGWLPAKAPDRLFMRGKLWLSGQRLLPLKTLREQLVEILVQVRVHNRQTVLLSPLPHGKRLEQQLAALTQTVYEQESRQWQVPLFNVSKHLSGGDELFQTNSATKLSAVAHELLGSELHSFVTEPTYTLWS